MKQETINKFLRICVRGHHLKLFFRDVKMYKKLKQKMIPPIPSFAVKLNEVTEEEDEIPHKHYMEESSTHEIVEDCQEQKS